MQVAFGIGQLCFGTLYAVERLGNIVTGDPADEGVRMGPLATEQQLTDAIEGIGELSREARLVVGTGEKYGERGFFLQPTLFEIEDAKSARTVHHREVFAPVATLMPYDGKPESASEIVELGGGTLVTSAYSDDFDWVGELIQGCGATTGRLYVGSAESAGESPGSGAALPQALHGGPGRAGGGEELGGVIGIQRYMQRLAVQGSPTLIDGFDQS